MQKYFSYPLPLFAGALSSYITTVLTGFFYPIDLIIWTVNTLKDFEFIYLGTYVIYLISQSAFAIISLLVFLLFGFLYKRFIKLNLIQIVTISSVGIILFMCASAELYIDSNLINFLLDLIVLVSMNTISIFLMFKFMKEHQND